MQTLEMIAAFGISEHELNAAIRGAGRDTIKVVERFQEAVNPTLYRPRVKSTVKRVKGFDANAQKAERKRLKKARKQQRKKLITFHP